MMKDLLKIINFDKNKNLYLTALALIILLILLIAVIVFTTIDSNDNNEQLVEDQNSTSQQQSQSNKNQENNSIESDLNQTTDNNNSEHSVGNQNKDSLLPANWDALTANEKTALNPYNCSDVTKIRADNGQCIVSSQTHSADTDLQIVSSSDSENDEILDTEDTTTQEQNTPIEEEKEQETPTTDDSEDKEEKEEEEEDSNDGSTRTPTPRPTPTPTPDPDPVVVTISTSQSVISNQLVIRAESDSSGTWTHVILNTGDTCDATAFTGSPVSGNIVRISSSQKSTYLNKVICFNIKPAGDAVYEDVSIDNNLLNSLNQVVPPPPPPASKFYILVSQLNYYRFVCDNPSATRTETDNCWTIALEIKGSETPVISTHWTKSVSSTCPHDYSGEPMGNLPGDKLGAANIRFKKNDLTMTDCVITFTNTKTEESKSYTMELASSYTWQNPKTINF